MKPITAPAVAPTTCNGPQMEGVTMETRYTTATKLYVTCRKQLWVFYSPRAGPHKHLLHDACKGQNYRLQLP